MRHNEPVALNKKLTAFGNSYGVVIDKPILELLNITNETELEVTTDNGRRIIIEPRLRAAEEDSRRRMRAP
jgi:antitoxin component of MazEF toxin-antitoxin module